MDYHLSAFIRQEKNVAINCHKLRVPCLQVGGVDIFATDEQLRRIADAINGYLEAQRKADIHEAMIAADDAEHDAEYNRKLEDAA